MFKRVIDAVIWLLPFLVLLIIFWLTFYQHPTMDDFAGDLLVKQDGLAQSIYLYLKNSNGRFFVVPIFLYFTSTNFFIENYFFLLIVFLILMISCYYFFVKYLFHDLLNEKSGKLNLFWLTGMFAVISLAVMPEAASFVFWITTGVVYLIPFLLMLFYILLLIIPFKNHFSIKKGVYFLLILLSLLLVGSNEVSIFFSFSFLVMAAIYYFLLNRSIHKLYIYGFLSQGLLIAITFLLPGNISRSGGFSSKQPWYYSVISGLYQALEVFYNLFSNTFFWIGLLLVLLFAPKTKAWLIYKSKINNPFLPFLAIFLINFFFCFFIRHFTGWVVPERSKNIMVLLSMIYLYFFTYLTVPGMNGLIKSSNVQIKSIVKTVVVLLFIFNPFSLKLVQTALLASIHNEVLSERVRQITVAKEDGKKSVHLSPYKETFYKKLVQKYGSKVADFVLVEFPIPPKLVYFKDEPFQKELGFMYAEYYEIDSIMTQKDTILRRRQ